MLDILPNKIQQIIMLIGAGIGAVFGYIFDGMPHVFYWLLIMVAVDYITGMIQAFINKDWSSKTGFKGIIKKIIIITIVVLFNGISTMVSIPEIETAVIFAFALNEMCSILENIERAGFGDIIPASIRKLLKIVEDKGDDLIDKLK